MVRLQTLGGLALTDGPAAAATTQRRRLVLLALLAVAAERGLTRDKLVAYLWSESPADNARHALEQLLYSLRRQLGDAVILGPDPLRLNHEFITSDVAEFERAIARGTPADAVGLYRGPFLDGIYLSDAAEFGRWVEEERSRLAGKYAWALNGLAHAAYDRRDYAAEIGWRRMLVAADPLDGGSALSLVRALASAGDGSGALQYARAYETLLREDLESDPDLPFKAFVRELRAAQASAVAPPQPVSRGAGVAASPTPLLERPPLPIDSLRVDPTNTRIGALETSMAPPRGAAPGTAPHRIVAVLAILVTLIPGAMVAFVWQLHRPVNQPTNPRLVAVFPFRVAGAAPGLGYLREGIVDLLAVKLTGEGGPRALDPRALLGSWHRALGSTSEELSPGAAVGVAERLGAGRLVDGAVVGTPSHLVLTASIVAVPSGTMRARASVAGTADSLPALIDRLTATLLAGESGRTELATLTSLPALRLYLDGQSALRAGRFADAFRSYDRALNLDSTFALAGVGLNEAKSWDGGDDHWRGLRLAWAGRDRLSPRDRARIAPWTGTNYPAPMSSEDRIIAAGQALAAVPESPDAWYEMGDQYYHWGALLGYDAPLRRAAAAFRRSLELDSSFAEPRLHLFQIAVAEEDTTEVRHLGDMAMAGDSANDLAEYLKWQMAYTLRDTAALTALRARFDRLNDASLWAITFRSQEIGVTLDDARSAVAVLVRRADSDSARGFPIRQQYRLAMNSGRPREALALLIEGERLHNAVGLSPGRITDALYWSGDSGAAALWIRKMAGRVDGPLARGSEARRAQYDDICTLAQWRLAHGQLTPAEAEIKRLRAAVALGPSVAQSSSVVAHASMCAELLEAWLAMASRQPTARRLVTRLDSLSRLGPDGWADSWNLVTARLLEAQGDLAGALASVRRRVYGVVPASHLSTSLLLEGRLAARVGDTAGAIRAYRHYIALRSNPEPSLLAERDEVRTELARLVGER